jgi:two-component system, LuxR family, sensor kinase FixL
MLSLETLSLMEAAVDAVVVIDHRGTILAANRAAHGMFGYGHHEMLGRNVSVLMPQPDRGAHDAYIARYLASGVPQIIGKGREVTAARRDGSQFPARLAVGVIEGAQPPRFVGLVRDISAEHAATAALKIERDRANAYLELHDAILLKLDAERRVLEVNARGSELLGASAPDLIGRDWLDFMDGDHERDAARKLLASALASGSSREREFEARDAAGERRVFYWRSIALHGARGEAIGWLCSGTDITDEVRREAETRLAQERLERVARLATTGEIATGIAHELNQPLAAIATLAHSCERWLASPKPDNAELATAVHDLGNEALRAGAIIHRLRNLTRGGNAHRIPQDLGELLFELRPGLLAEARALGVGLTIGVEPGMPAVDVDGVQIQHVVLNLARNAFEAVAKLPPDTAEVDLRAATAEDGTLEVSVRDNGAGVPAEVRGRLFEPFCTTKASGTGLGLAISRTIVRAHGGSIGVRTCEPRGTCFYFRLPTP